MASAHPVTPSEAVRPVEYVSIYDLTPHPRNYRTHTLEQLDHLKASIEANGVYRNIIATTDGTVLAGHGVREACMALGIEVVPVIRLPIDPESPAALKVLAGDNEIGRLASNDMDALAEILGIISEDDGGLVGTGFDEGSFASLLAMTGGASPDFDPEDEWDGMPEYEMEDIGEPTKTITINFASPDAVVEFSRLVGQTVTMATRSIWFPPQEDVRTTHLAMVGSDHE
jgi:hypothetical protein